MASETLHESADELSPATVDRHRAIRSIMEELEAIDWYDQRVDAARDDELRSVLAHNRDEEKEHATMLLEWLRRNDPKVDQFLREYLFASGSIANREAALEETRSSSRPGEARSEPGADGEGSGVTSGSKQCVSQGSLGIGSLKQEVAQ